MKLKEQVSGWLRRARSQRPWIDHALRAYDRHTEVRGGQLAAAVTYFGFLSFFPLLALVFSLVGYLSDIYPGAQDDVTAAVQAAFPSLVGSGEGEINIQDVIDARAGAGLIGLVGLLYAGLGWLDALRDGLRRVFGTDDQSIGLLKRKLVDVAVLAMLGLSLLASLVVSSLATAATADAWTSSGSVTRASRPCCSRCCPCALPSPWTCCSSPSCSRDCPGHACPGGRSGPAPYWRRWASRSSSCWGPS